MNSFSVVTSSSSSTTTSGFTSVYNNALCSNPTRSVIANSNMNGDLQTIPLRSTHAQMKQTISIDLLTACQVGLRILMPTFHSQREVNFLRMIDRKAPCLYEENVVKNAIRRYETIWLPLQVC